MLIRGRYAIPAARFVLLLWLGLCWQYAGGAAADELGDVARGERLACPACVQAIAGRSTVAEGRAARTVERAPSEARLRLLRPHFVFRPGELFVGVLELPLLTGRTGHISGLLCWYICRPGSKLPLAEGKKPAWVDFTSVFGPCVPLCFSVPTEEGVFDLVVTFASAGVEPFSIRRPVVVIDTEPKTSWLSGTESTLPRHRIVASWSAGDERSSNRQTQTQSASSWRLDAAGRHGLISRRQSEPLCSQQEDSSCHFPPPILSPPWKRDLLSRLQRRADFYAGAEQWEPRSKARQSNGRPFPSYDRVGGLGTIAAQPVEDAAYQFNIANWQAWSVRVPHPECPHVLLVTASCVEQPTRRAAVKLQNPFKETPVGVETAADERAAVTLEVIDGKDPADPESLGHAVALVPSLSPTARFGLGPADRPVWAVWFQPSSRDTLLLARTADGWQVESLELYQLLMPNSLSARFRNRLPVDRRLVGPYLHLRTWLYELAHLDPGQSLSAQSLYTAGRRLVERLKSGGFNAALVAVEPDSRCPHGFKVGVPLDNRRTEHGPSGGRSRFAADTSLDELELLFCLFDRAGLVLVPHVLFHRPLPELEAERVRETPRQFCSSPADRGGWKGLGAVQGSGGSGVELVGQDGRSWRQSHKDRNGRFPECGPLYNPLSPSVQAAVERIVRQLVCRYGHHRSFRAVSLEVGADTFLLWPGLEWGYDDRTVRAFFDDIGMPFPDDIQNLGLLADLLTGVLRQQWVRWRCERLAKFHKRLVDAVVSCKPSCRVLLSSCRVFRHSAVDRNVRIEVRRGGRVETLLRERGLDFSLYKDKPSLAVLRPWVNRATLRLAEQSLDTALNTSPWVDGLFAGPLRGSLLFHVPYVFCHVPNVELCTRRFLWSDDAERGPVESVQLSGADVAEPLSLPTTFLVRPVDEVWSHQKRLAHALAAYDSQTLFDNCWLATATPLLPETLRFIRTYRALPPLPFRLSERQSQPVVVRVATDGQRSYVYVVNDFPKPVDVWLTLRCPQATKLVPLGASRNVPVDQSSDSERTLKWTMSPYELWAARVDGGPLHVARVSTALRPEHARALQTLLEELDASLRCVASESASEVPLDDPGFESHQSDDSFVTLAGWRKAEARWTLLDQQDPHSGQRCLQIEAGTKPAIIVSRPFSLRFKSAVVFRFWARSDCDDVPLGAALVGQTASGPFRKAASTKITSSWRLYQFQATDLPAGAEVVHLELTVPAGHTCWLDDLKLFLQRFSEADIRRFTKSLAAARLAWKERRYADCVRLLNSYWCCLLAEARRPLASSSASDTRTVGSPIRESETASSSSSHSGLGGATQQTSHSGQSGRLGPRRRVVRSDAYR